MGFLNIDFNGTKSNVLYLKRQLIMKRGYCESTY
jgi:hypothetical protein